MMQKTNWEITQVKHRRQHFQRAEIQIEKTGITRITAKERRLDKLLHKRKKTILLRITSETIIEYDYPRVKIEDLVFDAKDQKQYQNILDAATYIRRAYREYTQKLVTDIRETVKTLLHTRGQYISQLQQLVTEPRKTLYNLGDQITINDDPIAEYQRITTMKITQACMLTATKIEQLRRRFPDAKIEMIYIFIYAIGRAQNAKFSQNEASFQEATKLLEETLTKNLNNEHLWTLTIPEFTSYLVDDFATLLNF